MVLDLASYALNPYAIPTFVTAIAVLLLGVAVLIRERASLVSTLFCLVSLTIGIWLFAFSWMYCATDERLALWWAKVAYLGVPLIPSSIYHFTVCFLQVYQRYRLLVWTSWLVSFIFAAAIIGTDLLIGGLYRHWWGYYPRYGWLSVPYLSFFFGLMVMSFRHYWAEHRRAQPGTTHQRRVRALMLAFAIAYLGSFDYLPKYGIPLYPFGYLPVLGFLVVAARTIWRYRLVDLTPAFAAKQILTTMADVLLVLDRDGIIQVANHAAAQLFGRPQPALVGKPLATLDRDALPRARLETVMRTMGTERYELTFVAAEQQLALAVSVSALLDRAAQPVGIVWIAKDVTKRKQAEEDLKALNETLEQRVIERSAAAEQRAQELGRANEELDTVMKQLKAANLRLEQLSLLDPLTELLNRRGLQQILSREIRIVKREGSVLLALLLDLDDFKEINDTLGYAVGDVVLKEIARKLVAVMRMTDHVARIGGDEFMILLPQTRPGEGVRVAEKVRLGISGSPISISAGETVTVTASLGLVTVSPQTPSLDELVSQAHLALYRSKQAGKNQVFYARRGFPRPRGSESVLLDILATFRRGDRFRVMVQPIVSLQDLTPIGYELLSRLSIEDFEMPESFFSVALEANMLTLVDHQCFKRCLAAAKPLPPEARRHLNLFPSTILNVPIQDLLDSLQTTDAQGTYCIELSEQQIIGDPSYLIRPVEMFKRSGVLIAIDDVGFGRSSLESLILLEPHLLKIDKRCVHGIAHDHSRVRSLRRLLLMAEALGTDVIAEGIESSDDLTLLKDLGVHYGQGFLLGHPVQSHTSPGERLPAFRLV